jgi:hypothetical protein
VTRVHRVVRVPLYTLVVILAVAVVSPVLTLVASVKISDRATTRQIKAVEQQGNDLREEQRVRACSVYGALVAALDESPPQGAAGQNLLKEYRRQYEIRNC